MPRLIEKLEWLLHALRLIDEAVQDYRSLPDSLSGGTPLFLDIDWMSVRRYLAPEILLVYLYDVSDRDLRNYVPWRIIIPSIGFKADVAVAEGQGVVQDLLAELRADDVSEPVRAFDLLAREVALRTQGNERQKGQRLIAQLRELIPTVTA